MLPRLKQCYQETKSAETALADPPELIHESCLIFAAHGHHYPPALIGQVLVQQLEDEFVRSLLAGGVKHVPHEESPGGFAQYQHMQPTDVRFIHLGSTLTEFMLSVNFRITFTRCPLTANDTLSMLDITSTEMLELTAMKYNIYDWREP